MGGKCLRNMEKVGECDKQAIHEQDSMSLTVGQQDIMWHSL